MGERLEAVRTLWHERAWGTSRQRLVTVALAGAVGLTLWQLRPRPAPPPVPTGPRAVTALGRLTPAGGVVVLSMAPGNSGGSEVVRDWIVNEGDAVRRNQLLGRLSSWGSQRQAVNQARTQLALSQAKLDQILAGERKGARQKAQADLAAAQVTLPYLQISQTKATELFRDGAISEEELGQARSGLAKGQANLRGLQGVLQDALTVRSVDVKVARADVSVAASNLEQAHKQLRNAEIRSPLDGSLLRIYSWPGMKETDQGLAQLGKVQQMQVWAQVFQTDVQRLRRGQGATIWAESGGFEGRVRGTIGEISGEVSNRDLFSINSNNNVNARVVLVKINLPPPTAERLRRLSGLNVNVRFDA